ncbi:thioesterase II family protein [Streptomyces sp. rh34]|uniref:thioesterase II family protein n=1 Tax=Streptomyces sp. rh34 TaxID=2034272 RepID=UPI0015CF6E72|nr:alpha/beta fold hydrolase [Streptomyces sp. rh34]
MTALTSAAGLRSRLAGRRWIVRPQRVADPRLRVICFPHAGAGAAPFTPWAKRLPPEVELCAIRFPGRENRIDEPPIDDIRLLVDQLEPAVAPLTDRPFVLLGHCSGSIVAFELARRLRASCRSRPVLLVVSAVAGPSRRRASEAIHRLPRDAFFERVAAYGGLDESVLADPEVMELFETTLRADFRLAEEARNTPGAPLDVPVLAVCGRADPYVDIAAVSAWREETSEAFSLHLAETGHFALDETMEKLTSLLPELLEGIR